MDGFEPGPIVREQMPLGPRVFSVGEFSSFAEEMIGVLGQSDSTLSPMVVGLAPLADQSADDDFARDVAPAAESIDNVGAVDDPDAPGAAIGAMGAADVDVAAQRQDLPGPDQEEPSDESDAPFENDTQAPDSEPDPRPPDSQE
jgi:hypothetical protein